MQSTSSEAQVTQSGQAIAINCMTCKQLIDLFSPMFGPNGTFKALVTGSQLSMTKDGCTLCKSVQFTHPTSILITRAASSLHASSGDGSTSFILLCCEIFTESYKYFIDGSPLPTIINSLQLALKDCNEFLQNNVVQLTDDNLRSLALCILKTKIRNPEFLVEIVLKALINLSKSDSFDTNMIEIIKMDGGDIKDSIFVDGLVLDHSGRHHLMPTTMENTCVLVTNLSLEYEKPEVNSEFYYSSAQQRADLANSEKEFILSRSKKIAELALELKKEGKTLLLITEKGIDQASLAVLAGAGILGLRRAKRRNLERLIRMCGGNIVAQVNQIKKENLGYCQKVFTKSFGDNQFTILEGTPFKGSCTILVRGNTDYERMSTAIKGTINSLATSIKLKSCIYGGIPLYRNLILHLRELLKKVHEADSVGYSIVSNAFEFLIKVLLKNEGLNIHENLVRIYKELSVDESIVENVKVVGSSISHAIYMAINLLMCDEIIKAGKSIKQ